MNLTKITIGIVIILLGVLAYLEFVPVDVAPSDSQGEEQTRVFRGFDIDTSNASIDVNLILSGGPGKDGIPALSDPEFESLDETKFDDEALGIFLDIDGDQRFYPFNILVWHEIVNDVVGDQEVAVTFCPLCGSSIVFDRNVEGKLLDFGVSGFLFESNLLMYDRQTESFWSQARGDAVVGKLTDAELARVPMQRITLGEVKEKYPKAVVLSRKTGHFRDYDRIPYGNYDNEERLIFPVSVDDNKFFAKELMLVVQAKETYVAFPWNQLLEEQEASIKVQGSDLVLKLDGSEVTISYDGESLPSYFEMWFSFATHHQDDSLVWQP